MSNPDELWFEAREMAASWTESHRLERNRMAYSLIPFPETHDELCREADDTQYLDYARQTPVVIQYGASKLRRELGRRSRTYQKEDFSGYAAEFVQCLDTAISNAPN